MGIHDVKRGPTVQTVEPELAGCTTSLMQLLYPHALYLVIQASKTSRFGNFAWRVRVAIFLQMRTKKSQQTFGWQPNPAVCFCVSDAFFAKSFSIIS